MNTSSRRDAIKWFAATLLLEPMLAGAKGATSATRELDAHEMCSELFSELIPNGANCVTALEGQGVFAAIYESPDVDAPASFQGRIRWLCLAVKTSADSIKVQTSSEVLLPHSDVHPVDVSLAISQGSVEVEENKVKGSAFQRWSWSGTKWLLVERKAADVFHDDWTIEEYNAAQSEVVVSKGKIYMDEVESVVHQRLVTQVDIARYDGGSLAT